MLNFQFFFVEATFSFEVTFHLTSHLIVDICVTAVVKSRAQNANNGDKRFKSIRAKKLLSS